MYTCERCRTSFGRRAAIGEVCPRCLARDGVRMALTVRLADERPPRARSPHLDDGLVRAVRRGLATGAR